MNKGKINIGIIGCGWITNRAHIPALRMNENINIDCVFDADGEQAEKVRKQFGIKKAFSDFDSFLERKPDGAIIATPNYTHIDYAAKCLERNINILCEKPIAQSSGELKKITELSWNGKPVFMPGFVNRFRDDVGRVKELISRNSIGEIEFVDAGWIRANGIPRPGSWFTEKNLSGGGVLVDIGSHVLDIACFFLDQDEAVDCSLQTWYGIEENNCSADWYDSGNISTYKNMNVEDTAIANIKFAGGKHIKLRVSWSSGIKNDATFFTIRGNRGTIKLKTLFGYSTNRLWPETIIEKSDNNGNIDSRLIDGVHNDMVFARMHAYFAGLIYGNANDHLNLDDAVLNVKLIEKLYDNERIMNGKDKNSSLQCEMFHG